MKKVRRRRVSLLAIPVQCDYHSVMNWLDFDTFIRVLKAVLLLLGTADTSLKLIDRIRKRSDERG